MGKSPVISKTLWFNILTLAAAALTVWSDSSIIADNPTAAGILLIVTSVVNVFLRVVTKEPLK